MTAPLTPPPPPHGQSAHAAHDPWQGPPAHAVASFEGPQEDTGPGMKTELRQAAVIAVAVTVCGVLLGLLWSWLAPHVPLVSDGEAVYLRDTEGEQAIGADGTFVLLSLAFGAVSGLVVFLVRRHGGIPLVVGLALGGLLGAVLAWQLGIRLGPSRDVVARATEVGKGVTFDAPLELHAWGALLAWPFAALVVHLGLTGLFGPRDPEPYPYASPDGDPYAQRPPEDGERKAL